MFSKNQKCECPTEHCKLSKKCLICSYSICMGTIHGENKPCLPVTMIHRGLGSPSRAELRGKPGSYRPWGPQAQSQAASSASNWKSRKEQESGKRARSHFRIGLAKIQLAILPGTMARYFLLETRLGFYLFLYLVVLKVGISLLGGGDVFSL